MNQAPQQAESASARRVPTPREAAEETARLSGQIERALQGKPEVIQKSIVCLIARGHLLLEDVPGVGKTTLARALAASLDACFRRIQFTSDLLPGDLTGLSIPESSTPGQAPRFHFQPGPIFGNVVLADEVNRASPKTQSALLEAMSEQTVSVDGVTHDLPDPFFVIATQNPLEHHGTHPLPESQLDRFLMRLSVGYPERTDEARVLREDPGSHALPTLEHVMDLEGLRGLQQAAREVKIEESLIAYLLDLVDATRGHEALMLGASTRGAIALRQAAQARALMDGRDYCIPEDIRELAVDVLAHRVAARTRGGFAAEDEETRWILQEIVERVALPL